MKLTVLRIGRKGPDWAEAASREYGGRLKRYGTFEEQLLKPSKHKEPGRARADEASAVLKRVRPRDWLIALDERGKGMSSEGLAELYEEAALSGVDLVFAIGGPHGHDAQVRRTARKVLKLSPMVLNHQVARVVLLEQLYRAWTIRRNEPYHH